MARKTVLVCDNCGKEVDEAQGATLRVTYSRRPPRLEGGRSLRRLRREDAGPRGRPPRPPAEAPQPKLDAEARSERGNPLGAATGPVLRPLYDGKVGLSLLAGPANAGKVALLLERYLARLDDEPILIVPNASDVDRVERDLLARRGCLFSGAIGTFDDLFERLVRDDPDAAAGRDRRAARADRAARGRAAPAERPDRAPRARAGSPTRCSQTLGELESGPARPGRPRRRPRRSSTRPTARELDRLGALGPRPAAPPRRRAAPVRPRRLARRAGLRLRVRGPDGRRVVAARGARRARRGRRSRCRTSPGAIAFASLQRTADDLVGARGRAASRSCRRARREYAHPALAHLERALFERVAAAAAGDRRRRALPRGRRRRAARSSSSARSCSRCSAAARPPSRSRSSRRRSTAGARRSRPCSAALGVPYAVESRVRLGDDAARARAARSCCATRGWTAAGASSSRSSARRTPASRARRVDYVEGRLRGRAIHTPGARRGGDREAARGAGPRARRAARRRSRRSRACARSLRSMLRSAYGTEAPPAGETSRLDLRDVRRARCGCSTSSRRSTRSARRSRRRTCSRRSSASRCGSASAGEAGRVAVLDLMRARTRRFEVVFVLGLEEGSLPRRSRTLAVPRRRRAPRARRAGSSAPTRSAATATSSTPRARARRGGSTSCARRRPTTARRASRARSGKRSRPSSTTRTSRARPRGGRSPRSPGRSRRRRPSASGCARSRSSRVATPDEARALADANDWARRLARARSAFRRDDAPHATPALLAWLGAKTTFGVTELERFADCSSAWLFERIVVAEDDRRRGVDAMLRGSVAHSALHKFYAGLPKELGARPRRRPRTSSGRSGSSAAASTTRCAAASGSSSPSCRRPSSTRASGATSRASSATRRASPLQLVPRRFEVGVRLRPLGARSCSAACQLGDGLYLSGKIDRIDVDPFSARGIVQDYKSGTQRALGEADRRGAEAPDPALHARAARPRRHRAARRRLPRARRRARHARPAARRRAPTTCPASSATTTSTRTSSGRSSRPRASARARLRAAHPRAATSRTTRRAATCPTWCDLWTMCRVERA